MARLPVTRLIVVFCTLRSSPRPVPVTVMLLYVPLATLEDAVKVSVDCQGEADTVAGENAAATPEGRPLHEKVTVSLPPPLMLAVIR